MIPILRQPNLKPLNLGDSQLVDTGQQKTRYIPKYTPILQPGVTEYSDPPKNPGTGPYLLCKTDPGSLLALYASLNMGHLCAVCDTIFLFGFS